MQKLWWLLLVLFLLLLACEAGDRAAACPEIWAKCSDREEFSVCENCVILSETTSSIARLGRFRDCATGLEDRKAISLNCIFEERWR